jgi:tRNA pseudouridine32 synthase/23S rRNA pseudouridine746 synthase
MTKSRSYLLAEVIDGEPNAETRIERLRTFDGPDDAAEGPGVAIGGPAALDGTRSTAPGFSRDGADGASRRRALYRLEPHSGKTHQLRVHMASLGLGIVNDAFYPELLDKAPDEYAKPLQLLARGIRFVDPITGVPVEFRSGLELSEAR